MEKYFKLRDEEEIVISESDILIMANDRKFRASVIVTTKRIVLLQDINKELVSNSNLGSRGVQVAPEYEVTYELPLADISKMNFEYNYNKLLLKDNNILKIYCSDFVKYIKN